jgi:hypothetical protein
MEGMKWAKRKVMEDGMRRWQEISREGHGPINFSQATHYRIGGALQPT